MSGSAGTGSNTAVQSVDASSGLIQVYTAASPVAETISVTLTVFGTATSSAGSNNTGLAFMASCLDASIQLPTATNGINYITAKDTATTTLDVGVSTYRSFGTANQKAFLVSCPTGDLATHNPVVKTGGTSLQTMIY